MANARAVAVIPVLSLLLVGLAPDPARAQIAGPPAGSKPQAPANQKPGSPAQNPSSTQPQKQSPSTTFPAGGLPPVGTNPLVSGPVIPGPLQQSYLQDPVLQQQMALYSTLQQLQLNAQIQAAQQQQSAAMAAAYQQQASQAAAASSRRNTPKAKPEEPEELFAKPEIKHLDDGSEDAAASRQLRLAKALKADADLAQLNGDRTASSKLKTKVGQRLSDISEKYPKTAAGKEAEKLLDELYRP
jgi:hypothetical protein